MKDFLRNNGILILIIALLLTLITAVLSFTFGGVANPFANLAGVVATPFRNGFHSLVSWTEGVYSDAFERERLVQELEELKQENARLREQARTGEAASRENERLRDLLGLKEKRADFDLESATVTAHGSSNWASTLTISKGSAAGVAAGDCVVDQYGNLVAVVTRVGLNWSEAATVADPSIELGARLPRTDEEAVLEGNFTLMLERKLKLAYLPEDCVPIAGDQVLTSGLGDRYPAGLLVGKVEGVFTDPSGQTRYAVVEPAVDLDSLIEVFVIKDFEIVE